MGRRRTDQALRAVGAVHGHWLGRGQEVLAEGWLHHVPDPRIWRRHGSCGRRWCAMPRTSFPGCAAPADRDVLRGVVEDAERWTQRTDPRHPHPGVHDDLNAAHRFTGWRSASCRRRGDRVRLWDEGPGTG
ncbi:hypothetical protein SVIOM342S_10363 [Streptomyces violaceorubidus]